MFDRLVRQSLYFKCKESPKIIEKCLIVAELKTIPSTAKVVVQCLYARLTSDGYWGRNSDLIALIGLIGHSL